MNALGGALLVLLATLGGFVQTDAAAATDELLSMLDEAAVSATDVNSVPEVKGPAIDIADGTEPNALAAKGPVVEATTAVSTVPAIAGQSSPQEARKLRQQFLLSQIEPVQTLSYEEQERNLNQLIAQLNSLEAPQRSAAAEQEASAQAEQQSGDPNASKAAVEPDSNETPQGKTEPATDPNAVEDPLLTSLKKAERVVNPLLLADALFRRGLEKEAYEYYQTAASGQAEQADNAQWALFQMANCCRRTDPAKAKEHYAELLSLFPNSVWNATAKSRLATIEWTLNESLKPYLPAGTDANRQ